MPSAFRLNATNHAVEMASLAATIGCLWLALGTRLDAEEIRRPQTVGKLERLDPQFDSLVSPDAVIEKLTDDQFAWSEGPVWMAKDATLLFSDGPANTVFRWSEKNGLAVFLKPSGYTGDEPGAHPGGANGLALDRQGSLLLCQHGDRRVARLDAGGKFVTLADRFEGKRFNSPNDLAVRSNGDVYFTDPPYGLPKGLSDPACELHFAGVFRLAVDGKVTLLNRQMTYPNGIAFSPDEKTLYVAQSDPRKPLWMAFAVNDDGTLGEGRVFADASDWDRSDLPGSPDGLRVDRHGNLFATGPGGVCVFAPDGRLLGRIRPGALTANCAFGGADGAMLYMTANKYLARIQTRTKGW